MTIFKYDKNNTEGAYPTALVAEGTELKKGNKIVATDIVDLYDVDINNPQDKQALTYENGKWVNGNVTGGTSCNLFEGYYGKDDRYWKERDIILSKYYYYSIFAYTSINNKIYTTLAHNSSTVENELVEYDPEKNTSVVISTCPCVMRNSMFSCMASGDNKLFVFIRSYDSVNDPVNIAIWIYDLINNTWEEKTYNNSKGYIQIETGTCYYYNGSVYFYLPTESDKYHCAILKYKVNTNTWTQSLNPFEHHPYSGYCTAFHNNKIYSYGGTNNFTTYSDNIYEYDISNNQWRIVSSGGKVGRYHLMDFVGEEIYIFGGSKWDNVDQPSNDFWV